MRPGQKASAGCVIITVAVMGLIAATSSAAGKEPIGVRIAQVPAPNVDLDFAISGTNRTPDKVYDPTGEARGDQPGLRLPPPVPTGPPPPGVTTQPPVEPPPLPYPPNLPGDAPPLPPGLLVSERPRAFGQETASAAA